MNENRSFGIELETVCRISKYELATKIGDALREAGFSSVCFVEGYSHTGAGNARWIVKPDNSICTANGYSEGAEIVSPVLKGERGLEEIKVVCEAITPYVRVNTSTGFHVHHGIFPSEAGTLGRLYNNALRIEEKMFECIPRSRKTNSYCKKFRNSHQGQSYSGRGEFQRFYRDRFDRYFWLNFESFWIRSTVEIRLAAGTYEYEKIANWVIITQQVVEKGLVGEFDSADDFETFCNRLAAQNCSPQVVQWVHRVGETIFGHRLGTMNETLDTMIANGTTVDDLIEALVTRHGRTRAAAANKVRGHLAHLRKNRNVDVSTNQWGDVILHREEQQTPTASLPMEDASSQVSSVLKEAIKWLKVRHAQFKNV